MKKQIAIMMAAAAMMFAAPPQKQTYTGTITDSMCKNADHSAMKMPDDKCVKECVKGMGAKYSLYDGKNTYILSDQKTPEKFAAKKVTVTGTLDEKTSTIQVDKIVPAK